MAKKGTEKAVEAKTAKTDVKAITAKNKSQKLTKHQIIARPKGK